MEGIDVVVNCFVSIRKNPKFLVPQLVLSLIAAVIAFIFVAPIAGTLAAQSNAATVNPSMVIGLLFQLFPTLLGVLIVVGVLGLVMQGTYIDLVSKWKDTNSLQESFNVSISRFVDLFLYSLMILIIEGVIMFLLFVPIIGSLAGSITSPTSAVPPQVYSGLLISIFIGLIAAIILGPLLFMGTTLVVLEKKGPIQALKSSVNIGKADFLGIIGVFVIFFIVYAVIYVISALLSYVPLIGTLLSFAVAILIGTFAAILAPMYYVTYVKSKVAPISPAPATSQRQRKRAKKSS